MPADPFDQHVSLSVLDRSLRLVRVPRCRLNEAMHAVVRSLWFREMGDSFFSLCCNAIEVSIFGEALLIDSAFGSLVNADSSSTDEAIIIDDNIWLALQVEQHSDDWEKSGARVKEISAPLAREGISIMFLATRYSDFLICKEHRLPQVLRILQENGFGFAAEPDINHSSSGRASPMLRKRTGSPTRSSSVTGSLVLTRSVTASTTSSPIRPNSIRDSMNSSIESLGGSEERGRSRRSRTTTAETFVASPIEDVAQAAEPEKNSPSPELPRSFPKDGEMMQANSLSSAFIASSLAILPDELVTVGLAAEHENVWREKLIRALFFCQDVLPPPVSPIEEEQEGLPAVEEEEGVRTSNPISRDTTYHTDPSPSRSSSLLTAALAQSILSEHSLGAASTARPSTPSSERAQKRHPSFDSFKERLKSTADAPYPVPFFGFTQTVEGASLTADIRLLRALFSPSEEGSMVYATGEGGLSGEWTGEIVERSQRSRQRNTDPTWYTNGVDHSRILLKCLQLDLSQFGLDKHGVVNALADLLTDEGINLLYSSTFKTACILTSKQDLRASHL